MREESNKAMQERETISLKKETRKGTSNRGVLRRRIERKMECRNCRRRTVRMMTSIQGFEVEENSEEEEEGNDREGKGGRRIEKLNC